MAKKAEGKQRVKPGEAAVRGGSLGPTKGAGKQKKSRSEDESLDEALEESFPASDPPAQTVPGPHKGVGRRGDRL